MDLVVFITININSITSIGATQIAIPDFAIYTPNKITTNSQVL